MTLNEALKGDDIELIELYLQLVYQNEGLEAVHKEFKFIEKYSFMEINTKIQLIIFPKDIYDNIWLKDPTKYFSIKPNDNNKDD